MALPRISVILPVRNEGGSLGRLLDQLLQQNYPSEMFEILVADGRSTDGTRALVEQKACAAAVSMHIVDNPGIRSGAGRNAGVAAATGDIILFIDGHCEIPSTQLLRDTVTLLDETGADCLCRPQPLIAFSPRGVGRIIADARASALGHGRDSLIYNMRHSGFVHPASSGATYRRAVFERVGLYDESFDACEDVEFNTRVAAAAYKAYTDPRLSVYYEPRNSFGGLFRQMMRYGIGRVRLARKHPESASISQWAPAALVAAFAIAIVSGAVAIPLRDWMAAAPAFPAAMFLLITLVASLHLGWRHGATHALLGPIAYGCIYLGLGTGMWMELIGLARERRRIASASTLPLRGA